MPQSRFILKAMITISVLSKTFQKSISANYRYLNTYVKNIGGDSRAINPRLLSAIGPAFDPEPYDLLLALSRQDMVERISNEIRSYYSKK